MIELHKKHPELHINNRLRRNKITEPERILKVLLQNKLNLKENEDFFFNQYLKTERGYKFPDFIIPKKKLIIEVDGEFWHKNKEEKDKNRDKLFEKRGYKTIHFTDKELKKDLMGVAWHIEKELN